MSLVKTSACRRASVGGRAPPLPNRVGRWCGPNVIHYYRACYERRQVSRSRRRSTRDRRERSPSLQLCNRNQSRVGVASEFHARPVPTWLLAIPQIGYDKWETGTRLKKSRTRRRAFAWAPRVLGRRQAVSCKIHILTADRCSRSWWAPLSSLRWAAAAHLTRSAAWTLCGVARESRTDACRNPAR